MRFALALIVLLTALEARAQFERPASPPIDRNLLRVGVLDAGAIVVPTLGAADGGFVTVTGAGLRANELSGELLRATTGSFDGGVGVGGALSVAGAAQMDRLQVAGSSGMDGGLLVHGDVAGSGTFMAPNMRTSFLDAGSVNAGTLWVGFVDAGAVRADWMTVDLLDAGVLRANVVTVNSLDAGSAAFGSALAGVLDAGAFQAGSAGIDMLTAGTIDGGVVYAHAFRNPDAGSVYTPGGVTMDTGKPAKFDGPTGGATVAWTGANLFFNPGAGRVVAGNGADSHGTVRAGTLSQTAVELSGASGNQAHIAPVAGSGALAADAGLDVVPVGNGVLRVLGGGVRTPVIGNVDAGDVALTRGIEWPIDVVPGVCNSTAARAMRNPVLYLRPDGGLETQLIACDGEEWYTVRPREDYPFVLGGTSQAQTTIMSIPPEGSTGAITIMNWTPHAVGGTGVTEFNVMQTKPDGGLNLLCKLGPIPCNHPPGQTIQATCPPNRWFRGPSNGGTSQNIIVARDAGCVGSFGEGVGLVGIRVGLCIPGSGVECE